MPRPSPPPWAPKHLSPRSRRQHSSSFSRPTRPHAHRRSCLTRQHKAVSKAAWWPWPLTFWPWKRCPSHVWRGLPLCQFWSIGLSVLHLDLMYATDVRQHHRLMPPPIRGGWHNKEEATDLVWPCTRMDERRLPSRAMHCLIEGTRKLECRKTAKKMDITYLCWKCRKTPAI